MKIIELSKIALIIFDLDDTLIHSNIDYDLMKQHVKNLFNPDYKFKNNPTIKELLEILENNPDKINQAYALIEQIESDSAKTIELIPNADLLPPLLKQMNVNSAILTNNSRQSVEKYLTFEKFKFLKEMGPIITRNDVSTMKPDPAGINKIIEYFSLNEKKSEVMYIGDSFIDADAAHYAGIRFLLVNSRKLDLSAFNFEPWKIFSNLSELIQFFKEDLLDHIY